jgi:DNA-binding transcriptional LysR family regulator
VGATKQHTPLPTIPCTLRQLEIFVAAAEDCHFAKTANRLGISQPAVSSHIAALEAQLGQRLFVRRKGSRPVLSSDGLALLNDARSFFAEGSKLMGSRGRSETQRVTVRVCSGAHLLDDCIKPRLHEFHAAQSDVNLKCEYVASAVIGTQLVRDGRADMLVYTVSNPDDYPLHAEVLRTVRFGLYASAKFAAKVHATADELATLPFILPAEGSEADRMVQKALLAGGILCRNVIARAQFSDVIMELAKNGHGVAALFETMVTPALAGALIKFDVELPMRYRTLFRPHHPPSDAAMTVQKFLREILTV